MKWKAVAFDLDGTFYPERAILWRSLPMFLANMRFIRAFSAVRAQLRQSLHDNEDFYPLQNLALASRLKITPEEASDLIESRIYSGWFRYFRKLRLYPFVRETLSHFQQAGLQLAVMSDFPIRNRLVDLDLEGWWDCAFSSEETGFLKPHSRPFLQLSQQLNLPPEEILYVGNSYDYDVLGALSVSMSCAHLCHKPYPNSQACLTFHDWRELQAFVLQ